MKFTDGERLTAADVVKWIDYYRAKGTFASYLSSLGSVQATGRLRVRFNLKTSDPAFEDVLDQEGVAGDIGSPEALADPSKLTTMTYGAGAYMLDQSATVPNSSYVYVRNPHFWDPAAQHWQKIVVEVIADPNSTLAALR